MVNSSTASRRPAGPSGHADKTKEGKKEAKTTGKGKTQRGVKGGKSGTGDVSFGVLNMLSRSRTLHSLSSSLTTTLTPNSTLSEALHAYARSLSSRLATLRRATLVRGQITKGPRRIGGLGRDRPKRRRIRKHLIRRSRMSRKRKQSHIIRLDDLWKDAAKSKKDADRKKKKKLKEKAKAGAKKSKGKSTSKGGKKNVDNKRGAKQAKSKAKGASSKSAPPRSQSKGTVVKVKSPEAAQAARRRRAWGVKRQRKVRIPRGWAGRYRRPKAVKPEDVKDAKYLQILLLLSERARVRSHIVRIRRAEASKPVTRKELRSAKRDKKRQTDRSRRAVKYASRLYRLGVALSKSKKEDTSSKPQISQKCLLELGINLLTLLGELEFSTARYDRALSHYLVRRRFLRHLSAHSATSSREQALYDEAMDEVEPLIRFCAYNMGKRDGATVDDIAKEFNDDTLASVWPHLKDMLQAIEAEDKGRVLNGNRLRPIKWGPKETIRVRNPDAVDALIRCQRTLRDLAGPNAKRHTRQYRSKSMKKWDKVLQAFGDAEAVTRRLAESEDTTSLRSNSQSVTRPSTLHGFVSYKLLSLRIQRDLVLISTVRPPSDKQVVAAWQGKTTDTRVRETGLRSLQSVLKLYDAVLQCFVGLDDLAAVQEREEIREGVQGMAAFVRAERCLSLACMHLLLPQPSLPSAVHLCGQAEEYVKQARDALGSDPVVFLDVDGARLSALEKRVSQLSTHVKRAYFTKVAKRPLFFDNAFNYVELPINDLEKAAGRQPSVVEQAVVQPVAAVAEKAKAIAQETVHRVEEAMETEAEPEEQAAEAEESEIEEEEQPKSGRGWFGGLWGRK